MRQSPTHHGDDARSSSTGGASALLVTEAGHHQRDIYDLRLTTTPEAAAQFRDAQERLLKVQDGAEAPLRRAVAQDPDFAIAHATLALLGNEFDMCVDGGGHLHRAQRSALRATERERSFVSAVSARIRGDHDHQARLLRHIADYPRDSLALTIAVPTIAFSGSIEIPEQAWTVVERARTTFGSDWWYAGLLAFVRQEQGHYAEAAELASGALATEPAAGHAAHALSHAFYEMNRHREGLRWLEGWIQDNRRTAFMPSHFSWHAALHELALGDETAVRLRYVRELSPDSVQGVRALVDSASLLWRARLDDAWPGALPIDEVLSVVDEELLVRPPTTFVAMHAAVALAARGDAVGLRRLGRSAALDSPAHRELVVPLTAAMAALVDGHADRAAQILMRLMPEVERFGGSKAQREIIELTLLHALLESGHARAAQQMIQHALDRPTAISSWFPAQRSS
jgi:tetratricopeptide (TPR) repeat protein